MISRLSVLSGVETVPAAEEMAKSPRILRVNEAGEEAAVSFMGEEARGLETRLEPWTGP